MKLEIRRCTDADMPLLQKIAHDTYEETFRPMNTAETMDKYLSAAFDVEKLRKEYSNEGTSFFLMYEEDRIIGYLKTNLAPFQSDINDPDSLEIERIYISKPFKGKGYGRKLLNHAVEQAIQQRKKYIWLGVWEKNHNAIRFYKNQGFEPFSSHPYKMGDEIQTDILMKYKM